MTGIRMIEPVMMEGDIERRRFAQAHQGGFSRIPVVVVGEGNVGGAALQVGGAIPLGLIGISAGRSIEDIVIMHPYVDIARIHGHAVVREQHQPQVPHFHIAHIPEQQPPSVGIGVVSDSLQGDIHLGIVAFPFDLQVSAAVQLAAHVGSGDFANKSDSKGGGIVALLPELEDLPNSNTGLQTA
ncbi:hypothetical protein D3C75_740510 [compost metagenome]